MVGQMTNGLPQASVPIQKFVSFVSGDFRISESIRTLTYVVVVANKRCVNVLVRKDEAGLLGRKLLLQFFIVPEWRILEWPSNRLPMRWCV
jgi:hypothetical protein